ncbi:MAG: hypothetical protein H7146_10130, partial [Burkholderiaceae bacterium]|nr:hypothetical protein [Microbacteriaceae bacterium]
ASHHTTSHEPTADEPARRDSVAAPIPEPAPVADSVPALDATGRGYGTIEGRPGPVGRARIDRILCDTGIVPLKFDTNGEIHNVGRDQRLFTSRQRIALAIRDGGCLFPDCHHPPSWCEAHHIRFWQRDDGPTDLADGILLCRHHHLLLHNYRWRIERVGDTYWLYPPQPPGESTSERIEMLPNVDLGHLSAYPSRGTAPGASQPVTAGGAPVSGGGPADGGGPSLEGPGNHVGTADEQPDPPAGHRLNGPTGD